MKNSKDNSKYNFDDLVRTRLREILSSRNWSVSRFASRYVEKYADRYSKMEAPSTSTARKLVEDDTHSMSEKESLVLDDLFQQEFYQMWLDEQKRILIEKHEKYALMSNLSLQDNEKEAIDSENLFRSRIGNVNKNSQYLTVDDIAGLIRRYLNVKTSQPFVVFSTGDAMLESVLRNTLPDIKIRPPRWLKDTDHNEFETYVCSIAHQVDEIDYELFLSEGIKLAKEGRKIILGVIISFNEDIKNLLSKYEQKVIALSLPWSDFTIRSWLKTPNVKTLSFKNKQSILRCLKVRPELPEVFKDMVVTCIESKWVRWPDISEDGAWMRYLDKLYRELEAVLSDKTLSETLDRLIKSKVPENWLMPECNRSSLLRAITVFDEWKIQKDNEIVKAVENTKFDILRITGNVPEKSNEEWKDWLDRQYNFCLVDYEYDALLDMAMTIEKHQKL